MRKPWIPERETSRRKPLGFAEIRAEGEFSMVNASSTRQAIFLTVSRESRLPLVANPYRSTETLSNSCELLYNPHGYRNRRTEVSMTEQLRVLIAKPGLDGHDRGAKVIARALRDAGMEVIYTGLRQTPEMIVESALQEDVDGIGLSILSGAHMTLVPRVLEELRQAGLDHIQVFVGGIIPAEDKVRLEELGVAGVFGPGSNTEEISTFIRQRLTED